MELEITHMIKNSEAMPHLSGSIAELGENAAKYTWTNAQAYAQEKPLLKTEDEIKQARNYLLSLGASWTEEELAPESEVQALVVQLIAGEIREFLYYESITAYLEASEDGQVSGNIFKTEDNKYFYTLE